MKKKLLKLVLFTVTSFLIVLVTCSICYATNDYIIGYSIDSNGNESNIYYHDTIGYNQLQTSGLNFSDVDIDENSNTRQVIGTDDRVVVPNNSMTSYPYRMVCRIEVKYDEEPNVVYLGTGFLVGPSTIMTACHVVYDAAYGFFNSISFAFGAYKDDTTGLMVYPYGKITSWSSASVGSYYGTGSTNDDWAIIDLNSDIGNTIGYFGLTASLSDNDSLRLYGYSGDLDGNLAYSDGVASSVQTYKFNHTCDTTGGASGAPVCVNNVVVAGIHHGKYENINSACKISSYIVGWIDERINGD